MCFQELEKNMFDGLDSDSGEDSDLSMNDQEYINVRQSENPFTQ